MFKSVVLAGFFACTISAHASDPFPLEMTGRIVYVEDGDTLTLLDEQHQQYRIRLTDLDAPESPKPKYDKQGQPFSKASARNLTALSKGKNASARCYEVDVNKRLVCRVIVGTVDVSLEQIRSGYAWANGASARYVRDARAYEYEAQARRDRKGLWTDSAPIPPWLWRRQCWSEGSCAGAGE